MDLWVKASRENVERLQRALEEFGIPIVEGSLEPFFTKQDQMVALGAKPFAVDFFNSIKGLDFESAWRNRTEGELFGSKVCYLSLADFVKSKRAAGRNKDLVDLALLEEVLGSDALG